MVVRIATVGGPEVPHKASAVPEEGPRDLWRQEGCEVEVLLNPDVQQPEDSSLVFLLASALESLVEVVDHKEHLALQAASPGDAAAPRLTVFHGLHAPPITIEAYLLRIAKYTKCSPACFAAALAYMRHLAKLDPALMPNSLNVHRLLLTGVLLGAKFLDDRYYNNAFYAKVGGISTPELNRLELEMLKLMKFSANVTPVGLATELGQLHSGTWVLDAGSFPADKTRSARDAVDAAAATAAAVAAGALLLKGGDVCSADGCDARAFGRKRRSIGGVGASDPDARRLQRRSMEACQVAA